MYIIETIYSPDDNGWYAEVIDTQTGKTIHTTSIQKTELYAKYEARYWCENDALKPKV